jgi:hypothetical protein
MVCLNNVLLILKKERYIIRQQYKRNFIETTRILRRH